MNKRQIAIKSGELFVGTNGEWITTTLGSCVAFCIFDRKKKIGGLVHFLLPDRSVAARTGSISSNPLNFGDEAIACLLKEIKLRGSVPGDLEVSIVGACNTIHTTGNLYAVAKLNHERAESLARKYGLHIAHSKVGSSGGMKLLFDTELGRIFVASASKPSLQIPQENRIRIKVMIVDDSSPVRELLKRTLSKYDDLEIVGVAANVEEAEILRKKTKPDVISLDIQMPGKDGVTYLKELKQVTNTPVIFVSDLGVNEASSMLSALEFGAFDYLQKPSFHQIEESGSKLHSLIIAANQMTNRKTRVRPISSWVSSENPIFAKPGLSLVLIGASTGGIEALREIFQKLPDQTPPILVVQHMPATFTNAFAERLNQLSRIRVKEAEQGDLIKPNTAYLAPGGMHMRVKQTQTEQLLIELTTDAPDSRFKPSVDYLFQSIARLNISRKTHAALLTGMGDDGAKGLLSLKIAGSFTIAQDESTCSVFGMPKVAIELDAAHIICPLEHIARALLQGKTD